jgi:Family of unknown function (DUF6186)
MTRLVTLLGYAVIAAGAVGLELAARRRGGVTFSDALTTALGRWPVRLVLLAGWLWLGWHVFVRVDWQ